jgi:RNA polymerase sigma factor (sigma-70 family)
MIRLRVLLCYFCYFRVDKGILVNVIVVKNNNRQVLRMCYSRDEVSRLMMENDKLVYHVVINKFNIKPYDCQFEDCIQEGRLALHKALRCYDDNGEIQLSTVMYKTIFQELYHYLIKNNTVSVSYRQLYKRAELSRKQKKGETLTEAEQKTYEELKSVSSGYVCLDDTLELEDTNTKDIDLWISVNSYIDSIKSEKEKNIMQAYVDAILSNERPNNANIADKFGVTRQFVSSVTKKHLTNLQKVVV